MSRIFNSITLKISVSILVIQSIVLALIGVYFSNRFAGEIDKHLAEKLVIPAALISQGALNHTCVDDLSILSGLLKFAVQETFIFVDDGTISHIADSKLSGEYYRSLLSKKEQQAFNPDVTRFQLVEFTDIDGMKSISSISPITSGNEYRSSLYIRINGEQVAGLKNRVRLLFFFGTLVAILLTSVTEAVLINRIILPRISKTSSVMRRIAEGDFSARIEDSGPEDQVGTMMSEVNSMISTIQHYTSKLQILNRAAEGFAHAKSKDDIIDQAIELIERQLPVVCDLAASDMLSTGKEYQASAKETVFTIPVTDDEHNYQVLTFVAAAGYKPLSSVDRDFIETLSRMVNVTIDRVVAFQNISGAEARYRQLFTSALEGILRVSPTGRIIEANPALASMTGYDSVEEVVNHISDVGYQMCADPLMFAELVSLLEIEERLLDREIELKRKDGVVFPVSLSAYSVRDDEGRLYAFDFRLFNIVERKLREQAERDHLAAEAVSIAKSKLVEDLEWKNRQLVEALNELKATQMQLMQSEKMAAVGMTAGGVAHDLNNILSGIVSYPELLLSTVPEETECAEQLTTILGSGKRAAAIVDDLLALTQGVVKDKRRVQLEAVISDVLSSTEFSQLMKGYENIEIDSQLSADAVMISCSQIHIRKVIMNLVHNSVATMNASGRITISTAIETRQRGVNASGQKTMDRLAVIRVKDNGATIPEENLKHIFEPFYTRNVMGMAGTGLGLTVVWNVVNEHNGRIEVKSDDTGTEFSIYFPVDEGGVVSGHKEQSQGFDLQGIGRILVIDDEPLQRDIARKILKRFGYEVEVSSSGEEAVEFLQTTSVDLVVLDMLMPPGINGLETYKRILQIHPQQKAIIVSGYSENKDVKLTMQLGAGAFVKKPYTMHQIAHSVKNELESERFT